MNAVSIRMLQSMGVPAAVKHVKRFGFDDAAVPNDLSLALGAGSVAPVSLAAGYATFANGGYKVTPYFIDRVTTADGEVLYESKPLICPECNTPPETPVQLEPRNAGARLRHHGALSEAARGAARHLATECLPRVRHAERRRDARLGYARAHARAQRPGRQDGHDERRSRHVVRRLQRQSGRRGVGGIRPIPPARRRLEQGGRTAIPMWIDFMREALAGTAERLPTRPPGIVEYRINPTTGLIAGDGTLRQHLREVRHRPLAGARAERRFRRAARRSSTPAQARALPVSRSSEEAIR